jgi:general nucleoside transport system permease protein
MTIFQRRLVLEQGPPPPRWARVALPFASVVAAALVGAVFIRASGFDPLSAYVTVFDSAFGSGFAIGETLVEAAPLVLTGLSVAVAFSLLVFNIGAEGQLYIGAIATAGVGLTLGEHLPSSIVLPLALLAGAVGGALFAALAGIPRAYFGTSEVVVTLMLNFVALNFVNYLIFSSNSVFRDPVTRVFPTGRRIPDAARLPILSGRVNSGILIAIACAIVLWFVMRSTRWGFEVRIAGDSNDAALYAGVNLNRRIIQTFLVSGALAGLAGAVVVAGRQGSLEPRSVVSGFGYVGILVAALSALNPLACIPVAVFIAAMRTAGPAMQRAGVPDAMVLMLQGAVLVFVVAGEFWLRYRVRIAKVPSPVTEDQSA